MAYDNLMNPEAGELENQFGDEAGKTVPEESAQVIPPDESEQTTLDSKMKTDMQSKTNQAAKGGKAKPAESKTAPAAEPSEPNSADTAEKAEETAGENEKPAASGETEADSNQQKPAEEDYFTVKPDEFDTFSDADEEIPIVFEAVDAETKKSGRIADTVQQVKSGIQEKYAEARSACKNMMDRLSYDLEQTNYNPYIRSTTTYRYEILKKSGDTEPVDVFEFERTTGYSLHAMAITTLLVAAADIAITRLLKRKIF